MSQTSQEIPRNVPAGATSSSKRLQTAYGDLKTIKIILEDCVTMLDDIRAGIIDEFRQIDAMQRAIVEADQDRCMAEYLLQSQAQPETKPQTKPDGKADATND